MVLGTPNYESPKEEEKESSFPVPKATKCAFRLNVLENKRTVHPTCSFTEGNGYKQTELNDQVNEYIK